MMNPEVKAKWVAALRSGKYEQGVGRLKQGATYCCLGVLCDISGLGTWTNIGNFWPEKGGDVSAVLPNSVMQWAGLRAADPGYARGEFDKVFLSQMNDEGDSFEEIAAAIEANL